MILIQVSDMHIKKNSNIPEIKKIIEEMVKSVKNYMDNNDDIDNNDNKEIIFCVLGDIIDRGKSEAFSTATKIFEIIRNCFKKNEFFPDYSFSFEFVPGNHDLVGRKKAFKLKKFDEFIRGFQSSPDNYEYSSKNFFLRPHGRIDLLLLNSATEECKYGKINFEAFNEIKKPTIIITHHTLMSLYDTDNSAIRRGNAVLEEIRKKNIIAMLHGHTHCYVSTDVGLKSKYIIGVGPFLKEVEVSDVNKQFNIFYIKGSTIIEVKNFTYQTGADSKFTSSMEPTRPRQNNFSGSSIKGIYDDVVTATGDIGIIRNLRMHLYCKYETFKEEIIDNFNKNIQQAKEWQEPKVNPKWYFNHGEHMHCKDKDGLDYIIEELKKKPHSSKAIIPLINLKYVIKYTNDNKKYLPSLINIQFAFGDKENSSTLFATIYLRSLEVAEFLKINLCEVYNMCEKIIKENIRDIKTIDLNIFAFRAICDPGFGCFMKAELDTEEIIFKLHDYIKEKKTDEIVSLLKEKKELKESKINLKGLYILRNTLKYENNFNPSVLESIEKLIHATKELKRKRNNFAYNEVNKEQKEKDRCFDELIEEFKNNE